MIKKLISLLLMVLVTSCSAGAPLELSVYKLRLQEMVSDVEKTFDKEAQEKFSESLDSSGTSSSSIKFKDVKKAKEGLDLMKKAFESAFNQINGITSPTGLDSKHETIKKFLNKSRDLSNEMLGATDDVDEFGKKFTIKYAEWKVEYEEVRDVLSGLSISLRYSLF